MSFHTDMDEWLRMSDPACWPVCQQLPPPPEMIDIIELPNSWLSAEPVECLWGACHLVAKRHVIELYELNDAELLGLMKEVQACARALKKASGAVKINYEIHGNTLPHLHVHLYPRYVDDPFPGQAIDYHRRKNQYAPGEFEVFAEQMKQEILRLTTF
jgi:diadenosine tetraphosphate (Ap4A) HIT family hydrolase